jgi:hypothetical protein
VSERRENAAGGRFSILLEKLSQRQSTGTEPQTNTADGRMFNQGTLNRAERTRPPSKPGRNARKASNPLAPPHSGEPGMLSWDDQADRAPQRLPGLFALIWNHSYRGGICVRLFGGDTEAALAIVDQKTGLRFAVGWRCHRYDPS